MLLHTVNTTISTSIAEFLTYSCCKTGMGIKSFDMVWEEIGRDGNNLVGNGLVSELTRTFAGMLLYRRYLLCYARIEVI